MARPKQRRSAKSSKTTDLSRGRNETEPQSGQGGLATGDSRAASYWGRPSLFHQVGWLLVILLAVAAVVHANGLFGVFVFDDQGLIRKTSLRDFWSFDWFRLVKRPVATTTFAANFSFTGEGPFAFHVVNLLVHLVSIAALFGLVRRSMTSVLARRPHVDDESTDASNRPTESDSAFATAIAASAALLWATHPLPTSAVVYIVQRYESMASMWILISLWAWSRAFDRSADFAANENESESDPDARSTEWRWGLVSMAAAYLAFGCKEMAAGLPLIIVLYDRFFVAASWRDVARKWKWWLILFAPLALGAALYIPMLIRASQSDRYTTGFGLKGITPWSYFVSQPAVFGRYVRLTFLPIGQALDYGWLPSKNGTDQWIGFAGWILILVGLAWCFFKSARHAVVAAAMLLILAPTSTFMPLQDIIFEHRFYLPSALLISGLIATIALQWNRLRSSKSTADPSVGTSYRLVAMAALVAAPLAYLTTQRNLVFTSDVAVHAQDCRTNPENPRAWYALGMVGEFDSPQPKIEMLRRAVDLSNERDFFYGGTQYQFRRDLADTLFLSGQNEEARRYFEEAISHTNTPQQETETQYRLALICSMDGDYEEAEQWFQKALAGDELIRKEIEQTYQAHRSRARQAKEAARQESQTKRDESTR